jgi:hypothetical protein
MHSGPQYTHAVVDLSQTVSVEIHLGVYVAGKSKITHEYDISIIDRAEAIRARQQGVAPRSSKVVLLLEAKHWGGTLRLPVAREFLGLCSDSGADLKSLVSNTGGDSTRVLLAKRLPVGGYHPDIRTAGSASRDELFHIVRSALRRHQAS